MLLMQTVTMGDSGRLTNCSLHSGRIRPIGSPYARRFFDWAISGIRDQFEAIGTHKWTWTHQVENIGLLRCQVPVIVSVVVVVVVVARRSRRPS